MDNRNGRSRADLAQPEEERLDLDRRWRTIIENEPIADPVRELIKYLLSRPWIEPRTLMGGIVQREPHHIARLRQLLEADQATVTRCLSTLAAFEPFDT